MNSILDPGDAPLSKEDLAAVQENAEQRLRVLRRRALYSIAALFLSCTSVAPFAAGNSLHEYWTPVGQLLVLLSMGLMVVCLYCCLLWWGAWSAVRTLKKS
jgi:hypothetical protein